MGIFDKIFSNRKKIKLSSEEKFSEEINSLKIRAEIITTVESTENEGEPDTYSKVFIFNGKDIKITEFNKQLNAENKVSPFKIVDKNYRDFWESNEEDFDIIDAYRIVNNFLGILIKEGKTNKEVRTFIDTNLSKFIGFSDFEFVIKKAKMYNKYSREEALIFLKDSNDKEESFIHNPELFIESLFFQSELLLIDKKYDEAFQNLNRISIILPKLEQYKYISWSKKISDQRGLICLKEKNPKYDGYLYYTICGFLFELLNQIACFPHYHTFYAWKTQHRITKWPYGDNEEFDNALTELTIFDYKDEILEELFDFGYNKLPTIYGIPERFDSPEKIEKTSSWELIGSEERHNLLELGRQLNEKFVDKEGIEIDNFVHNLIRKYYDMNNK